MRKLFTATTLAALTLSGAAFAQTMATAGTDLNMRSGPGVQHPVSGVIPGGEEVTVKGCIESANWCEVTHGEKTGWAYGDYLAAKVGEEFQPLYPNRQAVGVTVIEAPVIEEPSGQDQAVGGATGAAMGALVAGPLGAVVGAAAGGVAASLPDPDPAVQTYVVANPQEAVVLDGEVVVGAGVPETVTLYEVPDHADYRYVNINGQTVLVNPDDRKIVYIYR
ncbi:DUF1236 domain-containing protein [Paracoccus zhejiangensis]|uniref:SH3b domain-containing protein n=1 Tax=Paracoccus zhejiangensis TaxID=1077935 RepID=A0A2H5F237_9RHOB|nr:DUF1236 domain-containing protein [Paracoccus zhejiangensis]AUH65614.1 hypothetical protein CX676_16870 [Paracoccus zhejiangensis]